MTKAKNRPTILVIPDLHAPFHHPMALPLLSQIKSHYKPDVVVSVGDLIDSHTLSRWPKDPDLPGAADEVEASIDLLEGLAKLFPNLAVCFGNHDLRGLKKVKDAGVPSAFIRDLPEVLGTPRTWKWADHFVVDGINFFHGDGFSGKNAAINAAEVNRCNTVIGHIHAHPTVAYVRSAASMIFGMCVGCLVDHKALAFAYGANAKYKAINGFGVIENGIPHFVPVE